MTTAIPQLAGYECATTHRRPSATSGIHQAWQLLGQPGACAQLSAHHCGWALPWLPSESSASQGAWRSSCGTVKGDAPHAKQQSPWGPPEMWWRGGLRLSWLLMVEKVLLSLVVHGSKETMAKWCGTCFPLQAELTRCVCPKSSVTGRSQARCLESRGQMEQHG